MFEYEYTIHPAAMLFPMMTSDELDGLVDDIKKTRQRECITLWKGMLIDGRNRLAACKRLGIEPQLSELDDDQNPWEYVISQNLHRRHLDVGQKAKIGLAYMDHLEAEAKERKKATQAKPGEKVGSKVPANCPEPRKNGDSRDKAGALVGVSGKAIDKYSKIVESGTPELVAMVDSGKVKLDPASLVADLPKEKQVEIATDPKKVKEAASKIRNDKKSASSESENPWELKNLAGLETKKASKSIPEKVRELLLNASKDDLLICMSIISDMCKPMAGTNADAAESSLPAVDDDGEFKLCSGCHDPVQASTNLFDSCDKKQKKLVLENIKKLFDKSQKASPFADGFEEFWEAFPVVRKNGKALAYKAWEKAVATLRTLDPWPHDGFTVEEFLAKRSGDYASSGVGNSEFAKGPAPWLNQGCWDDPEGSWEKNSKGGFELLGGIHESAKSSKRGSI